MAALHSQLVDPSQTRATKPRTTGMTMVIDTGIGSIAFQDTVETAGKFIDFIKLGFGTSALYSPEHLSAKVACGRQHGVVVYPGGTFLEVALAQGLEEEYFRFVSGVGFSLIEISDGTIELPLSVRRRLIREAQERGFFVITEYGKKAAGSQIEVTHLQEVVEMDWDCGALFTIIEGRESGKGVGVFDQDGKSDERLVREIIGNLSQPERLIWEAPQKDQQIYFLKTLGRQVNLGNIAIQDIYSLESLRRGLRSDTFCVRQSSEALLTELDFQSYG